MLRPAAPAGSPRSPRRRRRPQSPGRGARAGCGSRRRAAGSSPSEGRRTSGRRATRRRSERPPSSTAAGGWSASSNPNSAADRDLEPVQVRRGHPAGHLGAGTEARVAGLREPPIRLPVLQVVGDPQVEREEDARRDAGHHRRVIGRGPGRASEAPPAWAARAKTVAPARSAGPKRAHRYPATRAARPLVVRPGWGAASTLHGNRWRTRAASYHRAMGIVLDEAAPPHPLLHWEERRQGSWS